MWQIRQVLSAIAETHSRVLIQVHGELPQQFERDDLECAPVRPGQVYPRRHAVFMGFEPSCGAQTPAVARPQSPESVLRGGGTQIVSPHPGKFQKFLRGFYANRVRPLVFIAGIAMTVPEKTRHRPGSAGRQRLAEHIERFIHFHVGCLSFRENRLYGFNSIPNPTSSERADRIGRGHECVTTGKSRGAGENEAHSMPGEGPPPSGILFAFSLIGCLNWSRIRQ